MRLRSVIDRLFGKKPTLEQAPSSLPFQRAASAEEVLARLADVDYELYGRDADLDARK